MTYCVACIGPVGNLSPGLYTNPEQARNALAEALRVLSQQHPGDAEEITGILSELADSDEFISYFNISDQEWVVWMYDLRSADEA